MSKSEHFGMRIITAELFLDDVLIAIFNRLKNEHGAQAPLHSKSWDIRSEAVSQKHLRLNSKWGGRLY